MTKPFTDPWVQWYNSSATCGCFGEAVLPVLLQCSCAQGTYEAFLRMFFASIPLL